MAELNRQIFHNADNDPNAAIDVDLGNWVVIDGKLKKLSEMDLLPDEKREVLTAHEMLRHILLQAKGERIDL